MGTKEVLQLMQPFGEMKKGDTQCLMHNTWTCDLIH
jgi:hypothetical protein